MSIGTRIKVLRERREVSQAELCQRIDMGQSQLSRYERGEASPTWDQVARILIGLESNGHDLFIDQHIEARDTDNTFRVAYWERPPANFEDRKSPTRVLEFKINGPIVQMVGLVPVDDRYAGCKIQADWMVPDFYPGDYILVDTKMTPAPRRVIVGFYEGDPLIRRLVKHGRHQLLIAANRTYPPMLFDPDEWQHYGVVINTTHNMLRPYIADQYVDEFLEDADK